MRTYLSPLFTTALLLAPVACDEAPSDPDPAATDERSGGAVFSPAFIAAYLAVDEAAQEELALGMGLAREELVAGLRGAAPGTPVRHLGGGVFESVEADDAGSGAAFTPAGAELTASRPVSKAQVCVPVVDWASICFEPVAKGVFMWCEIGFGPLSINSGKHYYGTNGMCLSGGGDAGFASATYSTCYFNLAPGYMQPFLVFVAEACWFNDCEDAAFVKHL